MSAFTSPNHNARPEGTRPDIIVIHYTDMASADAAARWLCNPASKVSCHYLIEAGGRLVQMVEEERRAWHAGLSFWDGTDDINSRSIGIELDNPGHRPDAPTFPDAQIEALIDLVAQIRGRWPVPKRNVVAHSDIAPMRKIDPGERFPWRTLALAGHALYVPPPETPATYDEAALKATLREAGYGVEDDEAAFAALVRAFHRRHLPERVEAPADGWTLAAARAFAEAVRAERAAAALS
ncbi:N-acetylmuramoyl-L-alanine amidase [Acuticoccus sp. M5D2P5]|uniref:N-acetylmuramoyl-L-alanine amidase n=1 Tax=Acuticoccus kalidii TaxID=2910977 RepID=UPI001F47F598|nr:N-acetylmuramoyl-L-alanine amidase [Acuticoccus kalidii]MCF3935795.1 N-acetylmuramoyl-L-alanine amidase [Acuticoccus kalidii]